jgi:hypothetical protein
MHNIIYLNIILPTEFFDKIDKYRRGYTNIGRFKQISARLYTNWRDYT